VRKFYRKVYQVVVLSEDEADDRLETIPYNVTDGPDCLHSFECVESKEMTGREMADALHDAGSEPVFFGLDDDGSEVSE
jgi:hypothetical protein